MIMQAETIVILWILCVNAALTLDSCQNKPGVCKSIKDCSTLYPLLEQGNLSQSTITYLKQTQCGFERKTPKVCCPDEPPNISSTDEQCGSFLILRSISGSKYGDFPWTVQLAYQNGTIYCSGALINRRYVLTAAHCIRKGINVYLGVKEVGRNPGCVSTEPVEPSIEIPIEDTILHDEYDSSTLRYDIALIRLSEPVDDIQPICFSATAVHLDRLERVCWGVRNYLQTFSTKMRQEMIRSKNMKCNKAFEVELGQTQMCVYAKERKIPCHSDDGGVLMSYNTDNGRFYAVGVASYSSCYNNDTAVYTLVNENAGWIFKNIKP